MGVSFIYYARNFLTFRLDSVKCTHTLRAEAKAHANRQPSTYRKYYQQKDRGSVMSFSYFFIELITEFQGNIKGRHNYVFSDFFCEVVTCLPVFG